MTVRGPLLLLLALVACASAPDQAPGAFVAFRLAEEEAAEGLTSMTFSRGEVTREFYLHDDPVLTEAEIDSAWVTPAEGQFIVDVSMTAAGREAFARATEQHVGRHLAMVVENRLVCVPVIRAPITVGRARIEGGFTRDEAERIAERLLRH
jgi:preprotein translocase subunit SecD